MRQPASTTPEIIVFLYLIQDLDVLLPILKALKAINADAAAFVAPGLLLDSPRVRAALDREDIPWYTSNALEFKLRLTPKLRGVRALISAADTTAYAHKPAHYLVNRANKMGIATYTLQHGLENIGLTYFDDEFPVDSVKFASRSIFIWGGMDSLHPRVSAEVRNRCIPMGCPKEFSADTHPEFPIKAKGRKIVAVFENLHWRRYSDSYRFRFLEDLVAASKARPDVLMIVKPHHAGRWLTDQYRGSLPQLPNLILVNPRDPQWEPFTAPSLINVADAVITTPSTTVFDAASVQKPVSVVGYDLDLSLYEPLPVLKSTGDWVDTLDGVSSSEELERASLATRVFRSKFHHSSNPATKIALYIVSQLGNVVPVEVPEEIGPSTLNGSELRI